MRISECWPPHARSRGYCPQVASLIVPVLVVRDTAAHVAAEPASHPAPGAGTACPRKPFSTVFAGTTRCCQPGRWPPDGETGDG